MLHVPGDDPTWEAWLVMAPFLSSYARPLSAITQRRVPEP